MSEPSFEDKLNSMGYEELILLEDELLLKNELSTRFRIRQVGGKFIILILGIFIWVFYLKLVSVTLNKMPENFRTLAFVPLYLGSLFGAVVTAQLIWEAMTPKIRFWLRMLLHYWPVTFYLLIGIGLLIKTF